MPEDLGTWQRHADAQLEAMGGAPDYLYRVRRVFEPGQVTQILASSVGLAFGPGQMKHEGEDFGRRVVDCATFTDPATLERMDIMPRHPGLAPLDYAIWNRYRTGGFITWHEDTEPGDPRTFSVVALLRAAERGGEFQLNGYGTIPLSPGEAVMFPAKVFHRVAPVLEGTRDSLTLWIGRVAPSAPPA